MKHPSIFLIPLLELGVMEVSWSLLQLSEGKGSVTPVSQGYTERQTAIRFNTQTLTVDLEFKTHLSLHFGRKLENKLKQGHRI